MSRDVIPVVLALLALAPFPLGHADEPKKGRPSASDLGLEVDALRTLYFLRVTPEQLRLLKQVAPQTMEKPRERAGKVSKDYREALEELYDTLVEANDEEHIETLDDRLDQLRRSEPPEIDDGVEITPAARKQVPEVLRHFKASQLAFYLAQVADEVEDPEDLVLEALDEVRGWKAEEWKQKREEVAEAAGRLVAGLDADKAARVNDRVIALLIQARDLKDDEFRKQRPELEKKAREVVGNIPPNEVLDHTIQYAMAQLLSNPRLGSALTARLR